jgi:hypothetical protein
MDTRRPEDFIVLFRCAPIILPYMQDPMRPFMGMGTATDPAAIIAGTAGLTLLTMAVTVADTAGAAIMAAVGEGSSAPLVFHFFPFSGVEGR